MAGQIRQGTVSPTFACRTDLLVCPLPRQIRPGPFHPLSPPPPPCLRHFRAAKLMKPLSVTALRALFFGLFRPFLKHLASAAPLQPQKHLLGSNRGLMPTAKQTAANRMNSQKSTAPREMARLKACTRGNPPRKPAPPPATRTIQTHLREIGFVPSKFANRPPTFPRTAACQPGRPGLPSGYQSGPADRFPRLRNSGWAIDNQFSLN